MGKKQTASIAVMEKGITNGWYYILKYIAMITMFADHLGKMLYGLGCVSDDAVFACNAIGRMAFPLFAFMLVEAFHFTKNRKKHLLQIGVLFLLSELPFDMALILEKPLQFTKTALIVQNTCLTLFLGFLMLIITNVDWYNATAKLYKNVKMRKFFCSLIKPSIVCAFLVFATAVQTDYAWRGILLIGFFEFARNGRWTKFGQLVAITLFALTMGASIPIYLMAYLALIPIYMAESKCSCFALNKRFAQIISGRFSKTICRFFYPAHLIILTVIRIILTM